MPSLPEHVGSEVYRTVTEVSPCAMLVANEAGTIVLANREAERLLGYEPGTLLGVSIEALVPEEARKRHVGQRQGFMGAAVSRPMGTNRDLLARRRDGQVIPIEIGLSPVQAEDRSYVVCAIIDLRERKRAEEQIARQAEELRQANAKLAELARTDGLTTLWNRGAFKDQLDIQLQQAARAARPLSVLLLDLDDFKAYNDRFGHLAGDEVLRMAAAVLHDRSRRSDFVARLGGEEFGIILPDADRDGAVRLGERFRAAVEATAWPRRPVTVSIGVNTVGFATAVPRPEVPTFSQVLSRADQALYLSKSRGRNRVSHADEVEDTAGAAVG